VRTIDLKYGRSVVPFAFDEDRFTILEAQSLHTALSDVELNQKLDSPIDSSPLEEIVKAGETVLLVVPDATRQTAAGQIVNLLVRRLIANGSAPHEIRIIFATGIHRKVTEAEKSAILTPFIAQRIKTLDHDARDLAQIVRLGETSGGIPIELNRALLEHDHIVLVGGVSFHYFAGFTGGRKLVCPGLASSRTVSGTHKLAFDCETLGRREGVDTGLLDGNAVHEAFVEAVEKVAPIFAINAIVDDDGNAVDLYCGNWKTSHRAACDAYADGHTVAVAEKRDLVIASCGGFPHDINMIQAHKTLDAASRVCDDGGTILLLAECADGLGRVDFLDWFEAADSKTLAHRLCEKYQINGQTAWSLLEKAERFSIQVLTDLPDEACAKMRLKKITPDELASLAASGSGYILPSGGKIAVSSP
jgi:nickel-dependent lactate racemase